LEIYPAQINKGIFLTFGIFSSVLTSWQLKLEGIHVDEEKTINDPELLMEVIYSSSFAFHSYILSIAMYKHSYDRDTVNFYKTTNATLDCDEYSSNTSAFSFTSYFSNSKQNEE